MKSNAGLPPLLWVRVLEAAVRHGSFVGAARELCVCPGAVSRTVKELEAFLGATLFERQARGVVPTETARTYARDVAPALRQIALASAAVRRSHTSFSSIPSEPGREPRDSSRIATVR